MWQIHRNRWILILLTSLLLIAFTLGLAYMIRQVMGANTIGADFYIYWQAGKISFSDDISPYAPDVTQTIQVGIYGKPAGPDQDQVAFAYPAYALVVIYPFIWLDIPDAQAIWMAIFIASWLVIAIGFSNATSRWAGATAIFFYPLSFGILLGNFNIFVGLAIFVLLRLTMAPHSPGKWRQAVAGVCMAVCLFKPQMAWVFLVLAFLLALSCRWWYQLGAFTLTSAALLAFSILQFPGWIPAWIEQSRRYNSYISPQTLPLGFIKILLPDQAAQTVSVLLIGSILVISLYLGWQWLRKQTSAQPIQPDWLLMGLFGLLTYLIHPWPKSYEQIVILVPFILWIYEFSENHILAAILIWTAGIIFSWAGLLDQLTGLTPLGIYAWPVLFFLIWQIAALLSRKNVEN